MGLIFVGERHLLEQIVPRLDSALKERLSILQPIARWHQQEAIRSRG